MVPTADLLLRPPRRRSSLRDEMFLSTWVVFCTVAIAYLQRIAIRKKPQDFHAQICDGHLINENFVTTTVVRPSPQNKYCMNKTDDTKSWKPIDLDQLINLYKPFNYTNSFSHVTPNSPIKQTGVLSVNDHQELPLFLKADIRHRHIRINPDAVLGRDVDEQMALMGELTTDDRVLLLPHSIGGTRGSNVVPMAHNVHQLPANETDIDDLGPPMSSWKSNEDWILRFLQTYPNGRVEWNVAVQYADGVVADPGRHRAYRPVAFARQFSAYINHDDDGSLFYKSNQTTLLNNNDDPCGRHFKNDIPPVPSECRVPDTNYTARGVGAVMSSSTWETTHVVSFPYTIENRTFFYGQSISYGLTWFIQELLPNGLMGKRISTGKRAFYYKVVFPYSIDKKHYFYSHRGSGGTYWFIQELLPDGKMGKKMADGNWAYAHSVSVPFSLSGKHYFYGQIESTNKWYIQELLPNGLIGKVTSHGSNISPVVSVLNIRRRRFLYRHDPLLVTWITQELFKNGTMGPIMDAGDWFIAEHVTVSYTIKHEHFFFRGNLHAGNWYILEIYPNGTMGGIISEGQSEARFDVMFTFVVNGDNFIYGHDQRTRIWGIRQLL